MKQNDIIILSFPDFSLDIWDIVFYLKAKGQGATERIFGHCFIIGIIPDGY